MMMMDGWVRLRIRVRVRVRVRQDEGYDSDDEWMDGTVMAQ